MIDIVLNENNEPVIINGDIRTGECELQETLFILQLRKGELKNDPVLGVNLQHFIKAKENRSGIERNIKINMERDGKKYDDIIKKINFNHE